AFMPPILLYSEFRGDFILNLLHPSYAIFLGVCVGSFLNVCLVRWKSGKQVFFPASHCPSCRHFLRWYENIPILSFLALRGKCRHCQITISWQYPLVELATAILFLFCSLKFKQPIMIVGSYFFVVFLILLSVSDIKWKLLPHLFNDLFVVTAFFFHFPNCGFKMEQGRRILSRL
ncbi:MAG: prepilin peptidase, partial [bacterium]